VCDREKESISDVSITEQGKQKMHKNQNNTEKRKGTVRAQISLLKQNTEATKWYRILAESKDVKRRINKMQPHINCC
jgi:hypothetical protein